MLYEIAQFADGMIIIEANHLLKDADVLRFWAATDMPIVTVIRKIPGDMISSVTIDDELGTTLLLQHLMDENHTQIAFCYQKHQYPTAAIRHEVYGRLMERLGLTMRGEFQVPVDGSGIDGYRAGQAILRLADRPSAIIGFNDLTAIGLIRACYDHGVDVPRAISIAGFDNIRMSELTTPSLTTMAANYPEIARSSIQELIRQIESPDGGSAQAHYVTKPKLIIRESTTRPSSAILMPPLDQAKE
jgi:LacI family transcriptional regulator